MRILHFTFPLALLFSSSLPMFNCSRNPRLSRENRYSKVGEKFYRTNDGKLYVRTSALDGDLKPGPLFYREVPSIDVPSYKSLGWYALDRGHVYIEQETSCGLSISVLKEADPATFSGFGYRWG
jgi:hypothetical protein